MSNLKPRLVVTMLVLFAGRCSAALPALITRRATYGLPGATQLIAQIYDVATRTFKNAQSAFNDPAFLQNVANGAGRRKGDDQRPDQSCARHPNAVLKGQTSTTSSFRWRRMARSQPGRTTTASASTSTCPTTTSSDLNTATAAAVGGPRFSVNFDTEIICHLQSQ